MLRFEAKLGLEFKCNASEMFSCSCAHQLELGSWTQPEDDRRRSANVKGASFPTAAAHITVLVPGK